METRRLWTVFWYAMALAVLVSASLMALPPFGGTIDFAPDQGINWYYWKRPDPDFWSRASAWGFYLAHQLFLWGLIAWAQNNREKLRERGRIHPLNWVALAGTAFFIALHYAQTALFYDGLGQDLPVMASQASVVLLLVIVLMMEAPRRGMFFGRGGQWFSALRPVLIRYHGYYFAWAVTFTYWYHPMEVTGGHILGFLYTFMLFMQAAFIFTRVHTNRFWTFALEISVLVHGVMVAIVGGQEFWPMFAFGFLFLVVVTQMHGLGLKKPALWAIATVITCAGLYVYAGRGFGHLDEVLRIPVIEYGLAFLFGLLLMPLARRRARR